MATSRAIESAMGAASAPTPAPNAAPSPSCFAGGNRRASKAGVARATAGTTRSARTRTLGRHLGEGRDLQQQEQDEAERPERADPAVAHDGQPVLGVTPAEAVEAIGKAVEMEAARQQLPDRYGEQPGQE